MEGKSALGPPNYENFIFDLDGTLFTIPVDWASVRSELTAITGEKIEGTPLFPRLQQLISTKPTLREKVLTAIDSYELRAWDAAKPMPGATEILYNLFEVARLALVTMQGRRACGQILEKHKVADLFEAVVTREDSMDRTVQLEAALNRLGARARETLFVGDRINDVVSARKVGVKVALVGREPPSDPSPDFSFPSIPELAAYFT